MEGEKRASHISPCHALLSTLLPQMDPIQPRCPVSLGEDARPAIHSYAEKGHQMLRNATALAPTAAKDSLTMLRTSFTSTFVGQEEVKSPELKEPEPATKKEPRPPKQTINRPENLLDLPPELLLMIFERRTFQCRSFRSYPRSNNSSGPGCDAPSCSH